MRVLEERNTPGYLLRIINSYLSDRLLLCDSESGPKSYVVTEGVPQGSVLGSLLCNMLYDGALRLPLQKKIHIIAYADDIAVAIVEKELTEIHCTCNEVIAKIIHLGYNLLQKNRSCSYDEQKKIEVVSLDIDCYSVTTQNSLRYLGVRLNFKTHIEEACSKAALANAALMRIMAIVIVEETYYLKLASQC